MTSKFPVVSENGNEYRVTVYEDKGWGQYTSKRNCLAC